MMRVSLLLLVTLFAALGPTAAGAQMEEGFGIYFDPQALYDEVRPELFVPFGVYLVLTRPLAPFDGFECTVTWSGGPTWVLSSALAAGGVDADPSAGGFAVTAPTPYPVTDDVAVLATWQFMVQSTLPVGFFIGPAASPSLPGGLPAVSLGDAARLCPVASCHVESAVAYIHGPATFPEGPCHDSGLNVSDSVTVSTAGLPDAHIYAGTLSYATDGQDLTLDFPSLATTGSPYLKASFEHPEWAGGPRFRRDIRDAFNLFDDYRVWPILVETDVAGTVSLRFWSNWIMDPPLLHDLQTGAVRYFISGAPYTFVNDGTPRAYRFELYEGNWRSRWNVVGAPDPAPGVAGGLTAWPNPFNPRTTLRFDLPRAGSARLTVYDLAGRLVRTLLEGGLPQGANEVTWNGRDDAGRAVGSGTYVARLEADGVVSSARLALLR